MGLDEKYKKWSDLYWSRFIYLGDFSSNGTNIPIERINMDTLSGVVGDGTINMANMLQLLVSMDMNGESIPVSIKDVLYTFIRLHINAFDYFSKKFPFLFEGMEPVSGFFLRDDINRNDEGFLKATGLKSVISSYGMINTLDGEDPCHSAFVSQDQVWNMSPILMFIGSDMIIDDTVKEMASGIGYNINKHIKDNGYTIYNPYLSRIKHFFTYLNLKEDYENRQNEREEKYRPSVKVKRGANNWYYSGGTSAACDAFKGNSRAFNGNLRTFLYKGIVFVLDRIWEPVLNIMGKSFKHNSIYCYGSVSGIWYNGKFGKRVVKRANKELEKKGEMFEPNILFLGNTNGLKWELVRKWLEDYPEPSESGWINSPVEFLYIYNWYNYFNLKDE